MAKNIYILSLIHDEEKNGKDYDFKNACKIGLSHSAQNIYNIVYK